MVNIKTAKELITEMYGRTIEKYYAEKWNDVLGKIDSAAQHLRYSASFSEELPMAITQFLRLNGYLVYWDLNDVEEFVTKVSWDIE